MAPPTKPKGLLDLPAELRVEIYNHVKIPFENALSDCKGLYLSCRGIKQEMDHEISKKFQPFLETLQAEWAADPHTKGCSIELLPLFSRIHLKATFAVGGCRSRSNRKDKLQVLGHLHLDTLEVAHANTIPTEVLKRLQIDERLRKIYIIDENHGFIHDELMGSMLEDGYLEPWEMAATFQTFHPRRFICDAAYVCFTDTQDWVGTIKENTEEGGQEQTVYRRVE